LGFGGGGHDVSLRLRIEALSGAAEMGRQLVDKLTLFSAHATELMNTMRVVRFFGFDNQIGEFVVDFFGEELVSPGNVLERLRIFWWSDFGGDVGVVQLQGFGQPTVAFDLRTLLVAVQLGLVETTRKVVAHSRWS